MINAAITLPADKTRKANASLSDVLAAEILQDNFVSDVDREEFAQAIKLHGITFLQLSNAPLPPLSVQDLSAIGRLARSLARFWPHSLVVGGCHD